jgi:hypothetical protein
MWKLTQHREPKGQQELKLKILLKEIIEYTQSSYSESFINTFKTQVKEIKKTNNFSADLMFQATPINQKSLEIWKIKPNGDYYYKMYTLDYLEPKND